MTQRERRTAQLPARAYAVAACAVLFCSPCSRRSSGIPGSVRATSWFADSIPLHMRLSTGGAWDGAAIDALRAWKRGRRSLPVLVGTVR